MIQASENPDRHRNYETYQCEDCQCRKNRGEVFVVCYSEPVEYYYVAGESDQEGQIDVVALPEVEPGSED